MRDDIVTTGTRHVDEVREINRELIEKALQMRCLSYLAQAKAQLLTETIFEVDESKKNLRLSNQKLSAIAHKKDDKLGILQKTVNSVSELMSFVDKNYVYLSVNQAYCRYHDKHENEIVGRAIEELNGKESFEKIIKPEIDQALSGKSIQYEAWFEFAGMGRRYVIVEYFPARHKEDKITGVVVAVRDITKRKNIADELQQHRDQLEQLVENRTQDLAARNLELERANKLMVDRELKMIELKEEIRQLKSQLPPQA